MGTIVRLANRTAYVHKYPNQEKINQKLNALEQCPLSIGKRETEDIPRRD